jgi:alpha-beta hydrolase superfamily lysophospholipase
MIRSAAARLRHVAPQHCAWQVALVVSSLLAACTPAADTEIGFAGSVQRHPGQAAVAVPHFTDGVFIADDGARLPLQRWLPQGAVSAVILALHGFGDYSHAFAMPASRWAARGIATYAFDQRGFGRAPGRGLWAGEGRLTVDAIEASRILRRTYPGRPFYLLGESMGGAVALLAATGAMQGVIAGPAGEPVAAADGLILSAPAVWGRATMDLLPRLGLFVTVRLFPDMTVSGRGLHIMASDNIPMLRALARDPLVLKEARLDTVYGLVDLMDDALAAAPRLDAPTLLLYGAHDEVVPRRSIREFAARLPPDPDHRRTLAYYPKGYHLLLRDLEGPAVAEDVAGWILHRAARLPSNADAAATGPWPPPTADDDAAPMPLARGDARR